MIKSAYIHIPFCEHICSYCDFCKMFYNEKQASNYLDALEKEIKKNYRGELLETIYIGGGTPSSLSISNMKKLFNILTILKKDSSCEITMEVNPENITEEKLVLMKSFGINRISMGIESTNDKQLSFLERHHDFNLVKEKIDLMKKIGFDNINVDLIYALPNETIFDLKNDLDNILGLPITHISTYSLMINSHTKLGISNIEPISDDVDNSMYEFIKKYLSDNGFSHYEISNFSRKGYESHHNLVYWHNKQYYGFGLGASGYIDNYRYDNTKSLTGYINGNYILNKEELNINDIISYELILGFRLVSGINKQDFFDKYNVSLLDLYNIRELIEKGLLIDNGEYIYVSYDKLYIENSILVNFV